MISLRVRVPVIPGRHNEIVTLRSFEWVNDLVAYYARPISDSDAELLGEMGVSVPAGCSRGELLGVDAATLMCSGLRNGDDGCMELLIPHVLPL